MEVATTHPRLVDIIASNRDIFASPLQYGLIGQTPLEYQGQKYKLRYEISGAKNRKPLTARLSLFEALPSPTTAATETTRWVEMALRPHEISGLECRVEPATDPVEIQLEFATRASHEGKGLATGLALFSDAVVDDISTRRPEQFFDKDVIAIIIDNAHPAKIEDGKSRQGWSTEIAAQLGYQRISDYKNHPRFMKEV